MPYIKSEDRTQQLRQAIDQLACWIEDQDVHYFAMDGSACGKAQLTSARELNPGILNYAISKLIHTLLKNKGVCYTRLNLIQGVLECVKAEFYRTVVSPYEDKKRRENGGVSQLDKVTLEDVR
jgi:exonuclease I